VRSISIWASTLGATSRPLPRPSEFTAEPRITAWIRSLSRNAASSDLSTMTATPSLRT
jgi:hypothetical protein